MKYLTDSEIDNKFKNELLIYIENFFVSNPNGLIENLNDKELPTKFQELNGKIGRERSFSDREIYYLFYVLEKKSLITLDFSNPYKPKVTSITEKGSEFLDNNID